MHEAPLYSKLLQFPLFQGMSDASINEVMGHTLFSFQKFKAGATIVSDGDPSSNLYFLTCGKVSVSTTSPDHAFTLSEYREAPETFQIDSIFGMNLHFTHTYMAATDCSLIAVDKDEVRRLYNQFMVFRINFINIISLNLQKSRAQEWLLAPQNMRRRIVNFIRRRSIYPSGEKLLAIRIARLAHELNAGRESVTRALHALDEEGLINLRRGEIHIPAMERLIRQA